MCCFIVLCFAVMGVFMVSCSNLICCVALSCSVLHLVALLFCCILSFVAWCCAGLSCGALCFAVLCYFAFFLNFIPHIGVDTDAIIMLIAARSNKQRQETVSKYQSMYQKVIL